MPLIDTGYYSTPYLVYNAPIDEKTKKIREKFKVDEATGYPEHYSWRAMARLGRTYKPEDPFMKFDPYNPDEGISTKVTLVIFGVVGGLAITIGTNLFARRSWWAKPHYAIAQAGLLCGGFLWSHQKVLEKQGLKYAMALDYMKQHPERFGEIYRPKLRETLYYYLPCR